MLPRTIFPIVLSTPQSGVKSGPREGDHRCEPVAILEPSFRGFFGRDVKGRGAERGGTRRGARGAERRGRVTAHWAGGQIRHDVLDGLREGGPSRAGPRTSTLRGRGEEGQHRCPSYLRHRRRRGEGAPSCASFFLTGDRTRATRTRDVSRTTTWCAPSESIVLRVSHPLLLLRRTLFDIRRR